jgi:hypothetical protein
MPRRLGVVAVVSLLLVPDWAAAFGWRTHCYTPPGYYAPPAVIYVPVCPTLELSPLAPPTVHVSPAAPPSQEMPRKNTQAPTETQVKPAEFATPTPAPPPDGGSETRQSPVAMPKPTKPPEEDAVNKVPKLELPLPSPPSTPTTPAAPPTEPRLELPPIKPATKGQPAKSETTKPEPTKTESPRTNEGTIPPIVLPQLPPPGGVSESKYRPATADRPEIAVLPVDGAPPAGATRKVGFYNYTGRDLELKIGSNPVALPARSYFTAEVPVKFTWQVGSSAEETTTIPADSAGVEVVLK